MNKNTRFQVATSSAKEREAHLLTLLTRGFKFHGEDGYTTREIERDLPFRNYPILAVNITRKFIGLNCWNEPGSSPLITFDELIGHIDHNGDDVRKTIEVNSEQELTVYVAGLKLLGFANDSKDRPGSKAGSFEVGYLHANLSTYKMSFQPLKRKTDVYTLSTFTDVVREIIEFHKSFEKQTITLPSGTQAVLSKDGVEVAPTMTWEDFDYIVKARNEIKS